MSSPWRLRQQPGTLRPAPGRVRELRAKALHHSVGGEVFRHPDNSVNCPEIVRPAPGLVREARAKALHHRVGGEVLGRDELNAADLQ